MDLRIATLVLVGLPMSGLAEELGQITAFLDGTQRTWYTVTMQQGGRTTATASVEQGARLTELHLQGHPEPQFTTAGVLSIDVRYVGPYAPGAIPLSVDILYSPEGLAGPFWTSKGANTPATLDILDLRVWGGFGRLEAVFAGELCLRRIISSATDPGLCKEVSGLVVTKVFAQ